MIYKCEWLCILVLNIDIVDDIWVVNMRERSAPCFVWSILGYSLFLFISFLLFSFFFFLCTFLIKCLSHRKPCKLVTLWYFQNLMKSCPWNTFGQVQLTHKIFFPNFIIWLNYYFFLFIQYFNIQWSQKQWILQYFNLQYILHSIKCVCLI